jgi:hypothetical protein
VEHRHASNNVTLPQGPSLRFGLYCPEPSSLSRPHPPRSQAHRDFAAWRLIRNAFAVRERLGDPRAVPGFRCTFLPDMPSPVTPGNSTSSVPDSDVDIGLRHHMSSSALPISLQSVSRRGTNFGASTIHTFATACQFARPPVRIRPVSWPSGTFTSGLQAGRSPFLPPDITTVATGLLYW